MLYIWLVLTLVAGLCSAQCPTTSGKTCKADHPYNSYYNANPCFDNSGTQVCFYSDEAIVDNCDCCVAACNCQSQAKNCVKCDSSVVPKNPDCSSDKSYCDFGKDNTMCQYCGVNAKQCGAKVCTLGLSSEKEKQDLVDKHNELRRRVAKGEETLGVTGGQPKAANMNKLVWADETARVAQRWADQCSVEEPHDTNRKQPGFSDQYGCGQNVYFGWNSERSTKKSLKKAVQAWYDEVKDFDKAGVDKYGSGSDTGVTGHYTQVVWGDATVIGCGYAYRVDPSNGMYQEIVVCNYCKGGNMMDDKMYTTGDPASACPADLPKNDDGLCSA